MNELKSYKDYGITDRIPGDSKLWKKVDWARFKIVVPRNKDKKMLQAAFEYIHYLRELDTDFVVVNQLAHAYLDNKREPGVMSPIVVDKKMFTKLNKKSKS